MDGIESSRCFFSFEYCMSVMNLLNLPITFCKCYKKSSKCKDDLLNHLPNPGDISFTILYNFCVGEGRYKLSLPRPC